VYRVYCLHCERDVLRADRIDTIDYDAMSEHLRASHQTERADPRFVALGELIGHFRLQPVPAAGDLLAQPDTNDASELLDGGIGPVVIE
jgi:hypothetical protein